MGKYHDRINWKKELRLLRGYIIVCAWVMDFSNGLKWDNYVTAWNTQNVSLYFFNSLVYAIVSCVGVLLISAPGAYVLSRWKFVGGKAIRIGLVIAMSVPTIMIIMPLYSTLTDAAILGRSGRLCCRWFSPPLLRLRFSTSCLCGTSSSWR